eukprot:6204032-Pleurochrysis_carterae.AAC.1
MAQRGRGDFCGDFCGDFGGDSEGGKGESQPAPCLTLGGDAGRPGRVATALDEVSAALPSWLLRTARALPAERSRPLFARFPSPVFARSKEAAFWTFLACRGTKATSSPDHHCECSDGRYRFAPTRLRQFSSAQKSVGERPRTDEVYAQNGVRHTLNLFHENACHWMQLEERAFPMQAEV